MVKRPVFERIPGFFVLYCRSHSPKSFFVKPPTTSVPACFGTDHTFSPITSFFGAVGVGAEVGFVTTVAVTESSAVTFSSPMVGAG